jgi:hypothetical protein
MLRHIERRLLAVLAVLVVAAATVPVRGAEPPPVLMFFPFQAGSGVPDGVGAAASKQIASELTAIGGVTVVLGDPSVQRTDFRSTARAAGADAYVTGQIVSIGTNRYAGLEQLVSARAGVLLWSNTVQFRDVGDLSGAGRALHDVLLQVPAAPTTAGTLPTAATPTPGPQFGGILVLPATGSASRGARDLATQAVTDAVKHLGFQVVSMPRRSQAASGLCDATHAALLVSTRLEMTHGVPATGGPPQTTAIVSLATFNCATDAIDPNPIAVDHSALQDDDAIRAAVTDALVLLPALPPAPNAVF